MRDLKFLEDLITGMKVRQQQMDVRKHQLLNRMTAKMQDLGIEDLESLVNDDTKIQPMLDEYLKLGGSILVQEMKIHFAQNTLDMLIKEGKNHG